MEVAKKSAAQLVRLIKTFINFGGFNRKSNIKTL